MWHGNRRDAWRLCPNTCMPKKGVTMQRAIIVYGLPPTFTVEALRELLSRFGAVQSVRLSPPDHSSFIIGYGEMKHRDEARQAVKTLHGTVVGGHTVIVHRSMPLSTGLL